jgi:hypothetical protein
MGFFYMRQGWHRLGRVAAGALRYYACGACFLWPEWKGEEKFGQRIKIFSE